MDTIHERGTRSDETTLEEVNERLEAEMAFLKRELEITEGYIWQLEDELDTLKDAHATK